MQEAGVSYEGNNPCALIVWYDALKDSDYFSGLKPWQIVNRIPNVNVLCRKVPFTRLIQRVQEYFPKIYSFMPKSFMIPQNKEDFIQEVANTDHRYIYKPDGGSLGNGIKLIDPKSEVTINDDLAVAQEYIESFLFENTKFDLRIYALLASVNPLKIYVYHDGLARFCSEEYNSDSIYSHLTNVTLNKENPDMSIIRISRLISEFFPQLEKKGIDTKKLWKKIEDVVALSIIASLGFVTKGEEYQVPFCGYSRCFQILGFDILLDKELSPHVLEVNYRPNLDYYRGCERRMKVSMIRDAILIAAPYDQVQQAILSRNNSWTMDSWKAYITVHPELVRDGLKKRKMYTNRSKYVQIWPSKDPERQIWSEVISRVINIPVEIIPGFKTPYIFGILDSQPSDLPLIVPKF